MQTQGSAQGYNEGELWRAQGKNPVSWKEEMFCRISESYRLRMCMPALWIYVRMHYEYMCACVGLQSVQAVAFHGLNFVRSKRTNSIRSRWYIYCHPQETRRSAHPTCKQWETFSFLAPCLVDSRICISCDDCDVTTRSSSILQTSTLKFPRSLNMRLKSQLSRLLIVAGSQDLASINLSRVYAYCAHADAKELQHTYETTKNRDAKMVTFVWVHTYAGGGMGKKSLWEFKAHYGIP